jgi:hypothetical protein
MEHIFTVIVKTDDEDDRDIYDEVFQSLHTAGLDAEVLVDQLDFTEVNYDAGVY